MKRKLPPELRKKVQVSSFFFYLFLFLAVISVISARRREGISVSEYRRGLDVVFAIDVSRSMDIRDVQDGGGSGLSRLEQGLSIIRESAVSIDGARFAVSAGRGKGLLAVPLTWDNEATLSFLDALDTSLLTGRSTNLETLIDASASAFQSSSPARKIIVLVSDGESLSGVIANAVNRCIKNGITITTVAVGSDEGRQITENSNIPGSNVVISRRESAVMRTTAEKTGGIYIDGNRSDAVSALSAHLLSAGKLSSDARTGADQNGSSDAKPKERQTLFIILAIIAYGFSKFIPLMPQSYTLRTHIVRTRIVRTRMVRTHLGTKMALLAVMPFIFSSCSESKILMIQANYLSSQGKLDEAVAPYQKALSFSDSAPYAEYGLGLTLYSLDDGRSALKHFDNSQKLLEGYSASEHREIRFRNSYNSGIIFFEEGDYHSAAEAFKNALRVDPRRIEAKHNLELTIKSISKEMTDDKTGGSVQQETREILFDYLREQEQQKWKSREWAPEENMPGADY